jgi:uncharacterized membrane protein YqjE
MDATAGLRGAAQQVLADVIEIGRTRLELATVELEEERLRLARLWVGATVTLFLLFVGVVLAAAWLVMWCPPEQRLLALGVLAFAFLAGAGAAAWRWQRMVATRPPLLQATLAELRRDERGLARGAAA